MSPVTTRRRGPQRVDARRRQGAGRGGSQLPTLFDPAQTVRAARVDLSERPSAVPVPVSTAAGSGETLDRLVVSRWERLVRHADAPCLVCGGTMEPRYGAHAASIGGRCRDCGTTLA
jgi:hypothetical protein